MGREDDWISSKLESVLFPSVFLLRLQYRTFWILHDGISSIHQHNIPLFDCTPANIWEYSRLDSYWMSVERCRWSYSFMLVRTSTFDMKEEVIFHFSLFLIILFLLLFACWLNSGLFHHVIHCIGVGWKQWLSCIWISHECDCRSILYFTRRLNHFHRRSKIVRIWRERGNDL